MNVFQINNILRCETRWVVSQYDKDVEVNVPSFKNVIKTFKTLSDYLGENKVSWRYDPIFITEKYSLEYHIDKFEEMASELSSFTNDCTIADYTIFS